MVSPVRSEDFETMPPKYETGGDKPEQAYAIKTRNLKTAKRSTSAKSKGKRKKSRPHTSKPTGTTASGMVVIKTPDMRALKSRGAKYSAKKKELKLH